MYTGHFGVALAAAGRERNTPLWLLIIAAFASDLVEGLVAAFRVDDPTRAWSHSAPAAIAAGVILGIGWRVAGGPWRAAGIIVLVAASHTLLDFTTAVKAVWPGAPPTGLHLYAHPYIDLLVEAALCAAGWAVWRNSLPPERRQSAAAWSVLGTLLAVQAVAFVHLAVFGATGDPDALSKFVR
jgi:membrane-bound metal-dependent hydrolase YbcI (DUF457 family)